MKKLICTSALFACLTFSITNLNAQDYQTAIGARLGYPLSASIKHFVTTNNAIEGYVGARWYNRYRWTNVSMAYLIHNSFEGVDDLKWYFGGGGSVYFWHYDRGFADGNTNTSFGIQGYLGLEYTFADVPISLSADWVPTIFVNGYGSGFRGGFGSVAVRYVLNR
ncbi:MAG: hypothetical protein R2825_13755 [Saprospiraceae bacterium]